MSEVGELATVCTSASRRPATSGVVVPGKNLLSHQLRMNYDEAGRLHVVASSIIVHPVYVVGPT